MSSFTKELSGITFMECKECKELKELSSVYYYAHKEGYKGFLGRCKDCIKGGRKTEHELQMARIRDRERFHNNKKRREYIYKSTQEREERKGYKKIHSNTRRCINKNGSRPKVCHLCGIEPLNKRIEAHHYDYNIRNEIIFCCSVCHSKLDQGKIDYRLCKITDVSKPF